MSFINRTRAAFLYGKAIKCFLNKDYNYAIFGFEKIMKLDPEDKDIRYTHYYIGRSYYALGKMAEAKRHMSISFELFTKKFEMKQERERDVNYFKTLAGEYIKLLRYIGEKGTAEKIIEIKNRTLGN